MEKSVKFRIELETKGEKALHTLNVDANDFGDAVRSVVNEAKKASEEIDRMSRSGIGFMATLDAIDAVRKAVAGLASDFNSFDTGMRAVNTMAGLDADGLDELKGKVEAIAGVVPLAKDELANGLYQVISNGVPEKNWIAFLEESARASVGGIADLEETVKVTSTVIKNYGLEWSAAGDIQNKIQLTAKNGVTSFEQLAQALPRVTGTAATLGVGIDELLASFATLTAVSGDTAEVSTQLAAIFTALMKPSGEAAEMASEMGIQFDAAAMQAAGGMQNFLTQLSADIRAYAQANGVLEEEVYGRLFGSAEALRALLPLTGEFSDTFEKNVAAMAGSAGTIGEAFGTMAGSAESRMQLMKNQLTTLTDWTGKAASEIQPVIDMMGTMGETLYSLSIVSEVLKKITFNVSALSASMRGCAVASKAMALHTGIVSAAQRMLAACSATAAASTAGLTVAVTALYAALTCGVALAVTGLSYAFSRMGEEAVKGADKTSALKDAEEAAMTESARVKTEIDGEMRKLRELIKEKKDTREAIESLNEKYGAEFGMHKTAAEWYDVLTKKSRDYVRQIGLEAQARVLAQQLAEKQVALELNFGKRRELWTTGKAGHTSPRVNVVDKDSGRVIGERGGDFVASDAYRALKEDGRGLIAEIKEIEQALDIVEGKMKAAGKAAQGTAAATDWQTASYARLGQMIEEQKRKVGSLAGVNADAAKREKDVLQKMEKRYDALGKKYGLASNKTGTEYDGKRLIENAQTYRELGNNIKYYQDQLEKTKGTETETIASLNKKIQLLKQQQEAITAVGKTYVERLGDELARAKKELEGDLTVDARVAAKAKVDEIQRQIDEATRGKVTIEAETEAGYIVQGSREDKRESRRNAEGRIQRIRSDYEIGIVGKEEMLREIDEINGRLMEMGLKPVEVELETRVDGLRRQLSDVRKELEEAVTVEAKVRAAAKAAEIQGEIDEATRGRVTIRAEVEPEYVVKGSSDDVRMSYENASGRARRIQTDLEIGLIGKQEAMAQIDDLNRQLKGLGKNLKPLKIEVDTGGFRKAMREMKKGWGSIKGIGSGVEQITEAVKGNGSAWEKTVGIVDGMISVYEGINGVVELVKLLTTASVFHKGAKTAEAVATAVATGATATEAAMAPDAAAAQIPVIAANKLATASYLELASAAYFAAHAYIPFAGFGIATGFATGALAITKTIGAMAFADGGVIYGPTLGLMGEYAGARSNPEVVAPLDRLRGILRDEGAGNGVGEVDFQIRGRRLVGVLEKHERWRKRN